MILPPLQFPGGQFGNHFLKGIPELPDHSNTPVIMQGQDTHTAGVFHHLPVHDLTIYQFSPVHPYGDNNSVIYDFALYGLLCQFHRASPFLSGVGVHSLSV